MWISMNGIYLNEELFQVVGCTPTQLLHVCLDSTEMYYWNSTCFSSP